MFHNPILRKQTIAGGRILSIASLNLFEIILSIMVLSVGQVLCKSSGATDSIASINEG
jgi:hypothetical protein